MFLYRIQHTSLATKKFGVLLYFAHTYSTMNLKLIYFTLFFYKRNLQLYHKH